MSSEAAGRRVANIDELLRLCQRWALGRGYDDRRLAVVRDELLTDTHAHAAAAIPVYRRLVAELGAGPGDRPLLTDDVFKSYDPRWLDCGDWPAMSDWLGQIHERRPAVDAADDVDDWLRRLDADGVRAVCSSGSSGMLSFVPRSADEWAATRLVGAAVVGPLLARRVGSAVEQLAVRAVTAALPPRRFVALATRVARGDAAFLLDFASGRTGNQVIGREVAASFRHQHALFPGELSVGALRALARGPRTPAEVAALGRLQESLGEGGVAHFDRMVRALRAAAQAGWRAAIFGTPYQMLLLCQAVERSGAHIACAPGSIVFFGGGWKTFTGEAVDHAALVRRVGDGLGVPARLVLEGYSMTELNTVLLRCENGGFHVPPMLEAFVVDEALRPTATGLGLFAFRDPLATSRPGFLVTGDRVHMVDEGCACGLAGPAVTSIERAGRQEVKGCAGIAASLPV